MAIHRVQGAVGHRTQRLIPEAAGGDGGDDAAAYGGEQAGSACSARHRHLAASEQRRVTPAARSMVRLESDRIASAGAVDSAPARNGLHVWHLDTQMIQQGRVFLQGDSGDFRIAGGPFLHGGPCLALAGGRIL